MSVGCENRGYAMASRGKGGEQVPREVFAATPKMAEF
jgi:hypothetical protein